MTGEPLAGWIHWLCDQALPLWADIGFARNSGSFVERLALDGSPQTHVPRRVMVQARQIHVYATAAHNGWFAGGADLALRAGDAMIERYCSEGGLRGWAFSCTADGVIIDNRRDLYAHAFVLLALASLIRLDPQPRYAQLVHQTLAYLDRELAHPAGGFIEQWPVPILPRRQNPHMHLLEALLALQEIGHCGDFSDRIADLIDLFDQKFLPAGGNVLAEFYDDKWVRFADGDAFEPGHHFEWVWLLARHSAMTWMAVDERIERLLRKAKLGVAADGRVVDQMVANGPVARTYRLWPAMEAAKAFAVAQGSMVRPAGVADVLGAAWQTFIEPAVSGGWIDRVDDNGVGLVDHMPASSLYHICTALDFLR